MLLDTSGLLCLLNEADPQHSQALSHVQSATTLVTHNLILAELVALTTTRRLNRAQSLEYISELLTNGSVETVWVDKTLFTRGLRLLAARQDKTYSLCDAVSFQLMRDRRLSDALTLDRDFEREGFNRLLV